MSVRAALRYRLNSVNAFALSAVSTGSPVRSVIGWSPSRTGRTDRRTTSPESAGRVGRRTTIAGTGPTDDERDRASWRSSRSSVLSALCWSFDGMGETGGIEHRARRLAPDRLGIADAQLDLEYLDRPAVVLMLLAAGQDADRRRDAASHAGGVAAVVLALGLDEPVEPRVLRLRFSRYGGGGETGGHESHRAPFLGRERAGQDGLIEHDVNSADGRVLATLVIPERVQPARDWLGWGEGEPFGPFDDGFGQRQVPLPRRTRAEAVRPR